VSLGSSGVIVAFAMSNIRINLRQIDKRRRLELDRRLRPAGWHIRLWRALVAWIRR
jgi:hypothetical protein